MGHNATGVLKIGLIYTILVSLDKLGQVPLNISENFCCGKNDILDALQPPPTYGSVVRATSSSGPCC